MVGTLQRLLPPPLLPVCQAELGDPPSLLWEGREFRGGAAGPATGGEAPTEHHSRARWPGGSSHTFHSPTWTVASGFTSLT